jgi:hypothetical protein
MLAVAGSVILAGCDNGPRSGHAPAQNRTTTAADSSAPATSVTTTTGATTRSTFPVIGQRTFSVTGVTLTDSDWLTVGLHPTTAPVQLHASAAVQLEICPAGLDGSLTDSSWPSFFNFPSCIPMTDDFATLPATNGGTHVAFAIKTATSSAPVEVALTVDYAASDTFVEVIPPSATSTNLTVTYTPESSTIDATVSPAGLVTPAPGYTVDISQDGRVVSTLEACDFPTEAGGCMGPVTPGQLIEVHVAGPGSHVVIYPSWK